MRFLITGAFLLFFLTGIGDDQGWAQQPVRLSSGDTAGAAPTPTPAPVVRKRPKPIRKEWSLGLRLKTDGWSLFYEKGWVRSQERDRDYFYHTRFMVFELEEIRHPKEVKRSNNLLPGSAEKPRQFIFGKINNAYAVKLGYGYRKMVAGKPEPKHVSIHWTYGGGVSMALLKPYYLKILMPQGQIEDLRYDDSLAELFLSRRQIVGGAGFSKGLGEIELVPGVFARTGLHFDFAANKTTKMAMETGISAALYTRPLEIMAEQTAHPYTFSIYASLQFGKRKQ